MTNIQILKCSVVLLLCMVHFAYAQSGKSSPPPFIHWDMNQLEGNILKNRYPGWELLIPNPDDRIDKICGEKLPVFQPSLKKGVNGLALNLAGEQQGYCAVSKAQPFGIFEDKTVMFWIKPSNLARHSDILTCKVDSDQAKTGWRIRQSWGKWGFDCVDVDGKAHYIRSSEELLANVWQHIAVSVSNSTINLYVNGTLRGAMELNKPIANARLPIILGNHASIASWYHKNCPSLDGLIDEVRFYNQVLSREQIFSEAINDLP